jgi:hypothetical protein
MQDGKRQGNIMDESILADTCLTEWFSSPNTIHPDGHHICVRVERHTNLHECSCGRFLQNVTY